MLYSLGSQISHLLDPGKMAGSLVMPKNSYHVRSTSMPSRSHPLALRVEDQLNKLKDDGASASSSSTSNNSTMAMLHERLSGLQDLYDCLDELIHSPLTQQALVRHRCGKWVDEMLDGSLRVLDVCGTARDVLMQMKGHAMDIQLALRRRRGGGEREFKKKVVDYVSSRKNMKKEIRKCLRSIKRTEGKCALSSLCGDNQHLGEVVIVLREVRSITISVFENLLSFMAISRPAAKIVGQSLVSKWFSSQRVVCEEAGKKMSDMERVDASLLALGSSKDVNSMWGQNGQNELEALDANMQVVEKRLDCVFRSLIKIRVSLLNILNS